MRIRNHLAYKTFFLGEKVGNLQPPEILTQPTHEIRTLRQKNQRHNPVDRPMQCLHAEERIQASKHSALKNSLPSSVRFRQSFLSFSFQYI
jgi:hypothetical protein